MSPYVIEILHICMRHSSNPKLQPKKRFSILYCMLSDMEQNQNFGRLLKPTLYQWKQRILEPPERGFHGNHNSHYFFRATVKEPWFGSVAFSHLNSGKSFGFVAKFSNESFNFRFPNSQRHRASFYVSVWEKLNSTFLRNFKFVRWLESENIWAQSEMRTTNYIWWLLHTSLWVPIIVCELFRGSQMQRVDESSANRSATHAWFDVRWRIQRDCTSNQHHILSLLRILFCRQNLYQQSFMSSRLYPLSTSNGWF